MATPGFEIPKDWGDPVAELREQCADLPEDDEDRLIREGEARYKAMSPEARATLDSTLGCTFNELVDRMQQPGAMAGVDAAFRRGLSKPE
jgi:hypothetical protein